MTERTDRLTAAIRTVGFAQRTAADEWVRSTGLTRQQAMALGYIADHQGRGVIARDLAKISRTTPASVASLLRGLEERGYITRTASPTDSRVRMLSLTEAGSQIISGFDHDMRATQERFFSTLNAAEQEQLLDLLERLLAGHDITPMGPPPRD